MSPLIIGLLLSAGGTTVTFLAGVAKPSLAPGAESLLNPRPEVWQHGHVSMHIPSPEPRLTADEYLGAAPDAFGDIEVVDGLVVHNMAQSEVHDLVVRRLAAALKVPGRPSCYEA